MRKSFIKINIQGLVKEQIILLQIKEL